ncbi:MAG: dTDP-glucose 4 6-dehydratase [Puniceicoccaceae bacterium 5H]|nr:MAG: dTDP-glucose 4 6-dehydratase [Puniceicoccaceae bacterium 5H]
MTGAAGFIGTNLVRNWPWERFGNRRLIVLDAFTYAGVRDNLSDLEHDMRFRLVEGDIGDRQLVGEILREEGVRQIVNCAAQTHVDRSIDDPSPFFETNVMALLGLLTAARDYWRELPVSDRADFRLLQISTDEVYGSLAAEDAPFTESHGYAPNSPYAASKAAGDQAVRSFFHTYGLPVLTVHCGNNYGPYQFPEKLIPLMILNALEGRELPVYGDGGNVRDWIYVEDHARAIVDVLAGGVPGEHYNVGARNERTNLDLVNELCRLLDERQPREDGRDYAEQIRFVTDRPGHDRRYAIEPAKLQALTGWQPQVSFAQGLAATVDWYLAHRDWCAAITRRRYQRERLGLG